MIGRALTVCLSAKGCDARRKSPYQVAIVFFVWIQFGHFVTLLQKTAAAELVEPLFLELIDRLCKSLLHTSHHWSLCAVM